jgi:uncharacterized Tic20 family protein
MNDVITTAPNSEDRNLAMLAHLLGIIGFLPSLIIWLVKKDQSAYVAQEAKEALNFQITMIIAYAVCRFIPIVGLLLWTLVYIVNVVFCVMAAVASSKGHAYRYPFALRLVN